MKRLFFLFFTILSFATSAAQKVAGVQFGHSYQECKRYLDQRFNGGKESYQLEPNRIAYYEITFAGEHFHSASFYFQNDGINTYLYLINFSVSYDIGQDGFNSVIDKSKRLSELFSKKYKLTVDGINEEGWPYFFFKYHNNNFVSILTSKGKNKKGEEKFWIDLNYGPIYFIDLQDEI